MIVASSSTSCGFWSRRRISDSYSSIRSARPYTTTEFVPSSASNRGGASSALSAAVAVGRDTGSGGRMPSEGVGARQRRQELVGRGHGHVGAHLAARLLLDLLDHLGARRLGRRQAFTVILAVELAQRGGHAGHRGVAHRAVAGGGELQGEDAHRALGAGRDAGIQGLQRGAHQFHVPGRAGHIDRAAGRVEADGVALVTHVQGLQHGRELVAAESLDAEHAALDGLARVEIQRRAVVVPEHVVGARHAVEELPGPRVEVRVDDAVQPVRHHGGDALAGGEILQHVRQALVLGAVHEAAAVEGRRKPARRARASPVPGRQGCSVSPRAPWRAERARWRRLRRRRLPRRSPLPVRGRSCACAAGPSAACCCAGPGRARRPGWRALRPCRPWPAPRRVRPGRRLRPPRAGSRGWRSAAARRPGRRAGRPCPERAPRRPARCRSCRWLHAVVGGGNFGHHWSAPFGVFVWGTA